MKELKCHVVMKDGKDFFGVLFLNQEDRVQDMLNDERAFIPLKRYIHERSHHSNQSWTTIVINKDSISYIEERC